MKFNDKPKRYKYELEEDMSFEVPELYGFSFSHKLFKLRDGLLKVRAGYHWDGPSGPTMDTPSTMESSLVHDVLYQSIRERMLPYSRRKDADQIFHRLMKKGVHDALPYVKGWNHFLHNTGVWLARRLGTVRAWYFYQAVRWFGGKHSKPKPIML